MTSTAAETWLRRWDTQQERYIADREERFTVLCDVVEAALADVEQPVVLDLGCGPGSLAGRLRPRLPHATIIGIDSDPLLLGLARSHYTDGITWIDADLGTGDWVAEVPRTIHAAVSTTALHWLPEHKLAELYRTVSTLMAPGGVFVNGDHMGPGDEYLNGLAAVVRRRRAARAGVEDNEDWGAWWDAARTAPELAALAQAREERLVHKDDHNANTLTTPSHAELLRAAGFSSVAPLWQVGDDHILVAVKR
ncbi:class I SAM-dependent methyltransferase [Actinosynnema sp. ALI-1.44]|uniref:class I SAM-dependent methyltransferase n=1 Tax=Actinosynnema sp. ALI-1.44 TaxID=1933779 RepID=UPI001EDA2E4F|nr:class I SAM-dependent methyltransferase [Actinosynnema sp. ALI-1.44]